MYQVSLIGMTVGSAVVGPLIAALSGVLSIYPYPLSIEIDGQAHRPS
jgi:hypothetical protein